MTNVCLLVRDRYALTEQCLRSLYLNTPDGSFNVVVVDDGSTDHRVIRLLANYTAVQNFSVLTVANSGHVLSQLKNTAVAYSEQRFGRGEWLYVGDSDTAYLPGWLEKLTAFAVSAEPHGYRLFGGQIHPFHHSIGRDIDYHESITGTPHSILDGPSWLMRWQTWDTVGPFDRTTAPGVCQSEEYPFCERIKFNGGRIGVIHPHVVIHTGMTHADGSDCVGRQEREKLIPERVLAL